VGFDHACCGPHIAPARNARTIEGPR
jgi:hypothetical protein